jgi:hypothetical protein
MSGSMFPEFFEPCMNILNIRFLSTLKIQLRNTTYTKVSPNIPVMSVFNMSPFNLQRVAGGSLIVSRNSPAPLREAMLSNPAFGDIEKRK